MRSIILDTGPLVAYLRESDHYHEWAKRHFRQYPPPFLTCEPVLIEAAFLLSRYGGTENVKLLFTLVTTGALKVVFRLADEVLRLQELMRRYQNVPMSLADACLVCMAELHPGSTVLTLDSDFLIYRQHDREPLSLLIPDCKP